MLNDCVWPMAAVLFLDFPSVAGAHQASPTWTYPLACCRSSAIGGDCHRVPDLRVREGQHGYVIRLLPGDHPYVTRRHTFLVPYGNELPSGDGDFHACLHPSEHHLNCFFAPPSGF